MYEPHAAREPPAPAIGHYRSTQADDRGNYTTHALQCPRRIRFSISTAMFLETVHTGCIHVFARVTFRLAKPSSSARKPEKPLTRASVRRNGQNGNRQRTVSGAPTVSLPSYDYHYVSSETAGRPATTTTTGHAKTPRAAETNPPRAAKTNPPPASDRSFGRMFIYLLYCGRYDVVASPCECETYSAVGRVKGRRAECRDAVCYFTWHAQRQYARSTRTGDNTRARTMGPTDGRSRFPPKIYVSTAFDLARVRTTGGTGVFLDRRCRVCMPRARPSPRRDVS